MMILGYAGVASWLTVARANRTALQSDRETELNREALRRACFWFRSPSVFG